MFDPLQLVLAIARTYVSAMVIRLWNLGRGVKSLWLASLLFIIRRWPIHTLVV
jgi:hypothetical protein